MSDVTVVCVPQGFQTDNILCLYGVHERMLNNLLARYDEGLVKDLYRSVMLDDFSVTVSISRIAVFFITLSLSCLENTMCIIGGKMLKALKN